jgi:hypothetical protein
MSVTGQLYSICHCEIIRCIFFVYYGGVAFITIKGALKIYHKQQQYVRQSQRKVLDFTGSNVNAVSKPGTSGGPSGQ